MILRTAALYNYYWNNIDGSEIQKKIKEMIDYLNFRTRKMRTVFLKLKTKKTFSSQLISTCRFVRVRLCA